MNKYHKEDIVPILNAIDVLVRHDEIERALWLCDNVPAYFRDNKPKELVDIKNEILLKTITPHWYAKHDLSIVELDGGKTFLMGFLRGILIATEILELVKIGKVPHIVDLGPGEFQLPAGLKGFNIKFTYKAICLNDETRAKEIFKDEWKEIPDESQPVIFVANEVIEHLPDVTDIKKEMLRYAPQAQSIHLSTPKYAFDPNSDWTKKDLGHLRAYTPFEFQLTISKMFPEFIWHFHDGEVMSLIGKLKTGDSNGNN